MGTPWSEEIDELETAAIMAATTKATATPETRCVDKPPAAHRQRQDMQATVEDEEEEALASPAGVNAPELVLAPLNPAKQSEDMAKWKNKIKQLLPLVASQYKVPPGTLPVPSAPGSPIRYTFTRGPASATAQQPATSVPPTPALSQPPPDYISPISAGFAQTAQVDDILHYPTRSRAVFWMNRSLIAEPSTMVLENEVYNAYRLSFQPFAAAGVDILSQPELVKLIGSMFKGSKSNALKEGKAEGDELRTIGNVAWKGLPNYGGSNAIKDSDMEKWKEAMRKHGVMVSTRKGMDGKYTVTTDDLPDDEVRIPAQAKPGQLAPAATIPSSTVAAAGTALNDPDDYDDHIPRHHAFPDTVFRDGRRLWHIQEPLRTKMWLRLLFELGNNQEVEESSLWVLYEDTFRPYGKKAPYLDDVELVKVICSTFPQVEEVEVAPEKHVIYGLRPRSKPKKVGGMLERYKKRLHERDVKQTRQALKDMLKHRQLTLSPITNNFQESLLLDPLLALPAGQPSPWLLRLRKRQAGGPLGDEQPGFPGISMQCLSRQLARDYRQDYEAARKAQQEVLAAGPLGIAFGQGPMAEAVDAAGRALDLCAPPPAVPRTRGREKTRQRQAEAVKAMLEMAPTVRKDWVVQRGRRAISLPPPKLKERLGPGLEVYTAAVCLMEGSEAVELNI